MSSPNNLSGYNVKNVPNFTPEMMNLFKMLIGGVQGGLGGGGLDWLSKLASGDESIFEQLEAPMHSQFQGKLGEIGSRFANQGAIGSSAFQNATSGAASDFAKELGANRIGLQQGAIERLLNQSQSLLQQKPYDRFVEKKTDWGDILGKILGGAAGKFF